MLSCLNKEPSVDGYKHNAQELQRAQRTRENTDITSERTENNRTAQQDQQQKHGDAPTADLTKTEAEART